MIFKEENKMAVNLSKGQRVSLDKSVTLARIGLGWDTNKYDGGSDFDLDASVFLLGANGKVLRDEDFVFYNNLNGRNGAVVHTGDNRTGEGDGDDEAIIIDFTKIPPEIEKIAVAVTIFDAQQRNQNFGQVSNAYVRSTTPTTLTARKLSTSTSWRSSPLRPRLLYARSTVTTATGSSTRLQRATRADSRRSAALTASTCN